MGRRSAGVRAGLRRFGAALALLALAACGSPEFDGDPAAGIAVPAAGPAEPLPPMKRFGATRPEPPRRPNSQMARDFLDLSFQLESGRPLPAMTRFEGPVVLRVAGPVPPTAPEDIARLIRRLRSEAGIDIALATPATPADAQGITIEFLPRRKMQALVPAAACFVVPRVGSWEEYRHARRGAEVDWTTLDRREKAAVFIPDDTSPQEIRDCLHEEVAQALGPLNDLYRLPDSVFNDDNFHTILTGFDMLMLRIYYAPELHSGMSREAVAPLLPRLFARYNPAGGTVTAIGPEDPTPRAWITAVETALGPRASDSARREAARRAVTMAEAAGWQDGRAGFAWFALGRLSLAGDLQTAFEAFLRAALIYHDDPNLQIQEAHVEMQLAAFALSAGQVQDAITFADRSARVVARAENAALLATLMLIKAQALDLDGRAAEARAVRLDAMGWARYGFGTDAEVRRRVAEIAALSPLGQIARAEAAAARR